MSITIPPNRLLDYAQGGLIQGDHVRITLHSSHEDDTAVMVFSASLVRTYGRAFIDAMNGTTEQPMGPADADIELERLGRDEYL